MKKVKSKWLLLTCFVFSLMLSIVFVSYANETPEKTYNRYSGAYNGNYNDLDRSYLYQNIDGTYTRVEALEWNTEQDNEADALRNFRSRGIAIEEYDSSFNKIKSIDILDSYKKFPLPCFISFYAGETYNYMIFGSSKRYFPDATNLWCIVQYDKNWNQIAETYYAGDYEGIAWYNTTCTEANGILYIDTGRVENSGHQCNITFEYDITNHTIKKNNPAAVSHRMGSDIIYDNKKVILAIHGDYTHRGIYLNNNYIALAQGNKGDPYTGMALGGIAASDTHYLVAYLDLAENFNQRVDAYLRVAAVNKETIGTQPPVLVDIAKNYRYNVPYIIKMNNDKFVVMWETLYNNEVHYVVLNGHGDIAKKETVLAGLSLSDCKPIVTAEGKLLWYCTGEMMEYCVSNGRCGYETEPTFYTLDVDNGTYSTSGYTPRVVPDTEVKDYPGGNYDVIFGLVESTTEESTTEATTEATTGNTEDVTSEKPTVPEKPTTEETTTEDTVTERFRTITYKSYNYEIDMLHNTAVCIGTTKSKKSTSLSIPGSVKDRNKSFTVTEIRSKAFKSYSKVKTVTISKNIKSIASSAFDGCKKIKSRKLSDSAKVKSFKVTNVKSKKAKLTWKKISGITGYQVQYSTSSKFSKATTKTYSKNTSSKSITLKKGKTYYFRIRSYKKLAKKNYYSNWSSKKKVKITK